MQGPLLSTVTETIGTTVMSVWVDTVDLGARCDDVVIYDAAAEFSAGPGDLLLAVGVDAASAVGVIDEAARNHVTAVVVRGTAELRECLSAPARRAGIALLGLAADIGWARFTGQLRGLLTTTGAGLDAQSSGPPSRELADFANALCESVGGSVVIFNPQQEVLASSKLAASDDPMRRQAVLDQRGPSWYRARLREHGVYRRLWRGGDVVDIPAFPDRDVVRRMAIAVRSGDEILGSIWIAERGEPLTADAKTVLRSAAESAAQYLLRLGTRAQTRRLATEAIARRVLGGASDDEVVEWLDYDWGQPSAVMSCVFADAQQGDARRFAGLLSVHLPAMDCVAVPVPARGRVNVLLCQLGGRDAAELAAAAREIVQRAASAAGTAVLAALGPVVPGAEQVPDSLAEADLVLRVLRRGGAAITRVVRTEEVRAATDVLALADEVGSRPRFAHGPVPDLLAYDRVHRTGYAASLAAYLDALGDVIAASRALHVHPNTLRYRLRRMAPICGIDLDDPDERLVAALHLRLADLDQPTTRGSKAETPD